LGSCEQSWNYPAVEPGDRQGDSGGGAPASRSFDADEVDRACQDRGGVIGHDLLAPIGFVLPPAFAAVPTIVSTMGVAANAQLSGESHDSYRFSPMYRS
jgi:hypothetical protein